MNLAKEKFENLKKEHKSNRFPPFHYGSHYSSAALVLYYMIRLMPFSKFALALQGGKFDLSDRLFQSFMETWSLANSLDYKELIPEIFTLPEFLINMNNFSFGKTQMNLKVNDIELPQWCLGDPRFFVNFQRKALESNFVSLNLQKWIDLIFGERQKGKMGVESLNIFYFLTYEDAIDINLYETIMERNAVLDQINEYGQTPKQLFKKIHLEKKKNLKCEFVLYNLTRNSKFRCEVISKTESQIEKIVNQAELLNDNIGIKSFKNFYKTLENIISNKEKIKMQNFKNFINKILENNPEKIDEMPYLMMKRESMAYFEEKIKENYKFSNQANIFYSKIFDKLFLLSKDPKNNKSRILDICDLSEVKNAKRIEFEINSNKLVIGSDLGSVFIYELSIDEKINLPAKDDSLIFVDIPNPKNMNTDKKNFIKTKIINTYLDESEKNKAFYFQKLQKIKNSTEISKGKDYSSISSETLFVNRESFDKKEGKKLILTKIFEDDNSDQNEKKLELKIKKIKLKERLNNGHLSKIKFMEFSKSFGVLITADIEG